MIVALVVSAVVLSLSILVAARWIASAYQAPEPPEISIGQPEIRISQPDIILPEIRISQPDIHITQPNIEIVTARPHPEPVEEPKPEPEPWRDDSVPVSHLGPKEGLQANLGHGMFSTPRMNV